VLKIKLSRLLNASPARRYVHIATRCLKKLQSLNILWLNINCTRRPHRIKQTSVA